MGHQKGSPRQILKKSLSENSTDAYKYFDKISLSYFYNKKIGISKITNNPSFLNEQEQFLNSGLVAYVEALPASYIADSVIATKDSMLLKQETTCRYACIDSFQLQPGGCGPDTVILDKISSNSFYLKTRANATAVLVLTQNYHHHWKVWVDDKPGTILKTNISFMGTTVPAGEHKVIFKFVPVNTLWAIWIMATMLAILLLIFVISLKKQYQRKSISLQ